MVYNEYSPNGQWPFGGEGGPDDKPVPSGDTAVKISEILASVDAGEYTFGGCAETLPALPGLYVDGIGLISLPLTQDQATDLIAKCQKSPFGHNMDTKMDESVRKSWQLSPDQVQMKNPSWQSGMEKLTETIGDRLGYKGVKLQCLLYKLLVYEEGGHFTKHQDTEKEDGMIGTLVVQPPSSHGGGDLVVYRNGEVSCRHDFGKSEGTAGYFNHYAVHYADAEHALEKITKGYRLALVYSVCLPTGMQDIKRNLDSVVTDLARVIQGMDTEESFALLLSHQYTEKSIEEMGCGALKGVDNARFRALDEANALAPSDHKLRFFIAKLSQDVDNLLDEDGWANWFGDQAIHWYSASGDTLGRFPIGYSFSETELNFLNPGHETFLELWKAYTSTGDVYTRNEGMVRRTTYLRFAVVAWPEAKYIENVLYFMPPETAAELLVARRPIDIKIVKQLLEAASKKHRWGLKDSYGNLLKASLRFSRAMCDLLLDTNDLNLAVEFFSNFCLRLGYLEENKTLLPGIMKAIQMFDWSVIGEAVLGVLGDTNKMVLVEEYPEDEEKPKLTKVGGFGNDSSSELLLQVASGLSDGEAKQCVVKAAVGNGLDVRSATVARVLWEHVSTHTELVAEVVAKLQQKQPHELVPFTDCFLQYIADLDEEDEMCSQLRGIADKRREWLREEIQRLEKPFSWEMPYAKKTKDKILGFLRGPDETMTMEFKKHGVYVANNFVKEILSRGPWHASVTMEIDTIAKKASYVKFTKTRKWFDDETAKIPEYKLELELLDNLDTFSNERKKVQLTK
ncbi:hypothetical protein P3T76_012051 [Phytophthora citrophthora]|uniref:Fe2OG dioxygenase domain-containing protein n=1 Tax=Phytophthora citrophthora TaxID=4793 RepID=A0AAD9LE47_9STRA|nr:hypothetical protein P3T76_012051 [Phytophthora citrophthora]